MARAAELGIDTAEDGGKWASVCEANNVHVLSATLALASNATGLDYCDDCRRRRKREAATSEKTAKA